MKSHSTLKNKRVLITCGPTWVPIDAMRVISNRSSGALGQQLAEDFSKAGARVTLLEGPVANPLNMNSVRILKFQYYKEFAALIRKELEHPYDICCHAAAVSDYAMKQPRRTKLSSRLKKLTLTLVPTPKIITQIKRINPDIFLVGFKLESHLTRASAIQKARSLTQNSRCDLTVANSYEGRSYSGFIIGPDMNILAHKRSRAALSRSLVNTIKAKI